MSFSFTMVPKFKVCHFIFPSYVSTFGIEAFIKCSCSNHYGTNLIQTRSLRYRSKQSSKSEKESKNNDDDLKTVFLGKEMEKVRKRFEEDMEKISKEYKNKYGEDLPGVSFKSINFNRAAAFIIMVTSTVLFVVILTRIVWNGNTTNKLFDTSAPHVSVRTFIEKYLRVGEVRSVTIFPDKEMAIAVIQEGAVIDNLPFSGSSVIVDIGSSDPRKLEQEIRQEENRLEIPFSNRLLVDYAGFETGYMGFPVLLILTLLPLFLMRKYMRKSPSKSDKSPN